MEAAEPNTTLALKDNLFNIINEECLNCEINPVCRGCRAIIHSHGLDIFNQKDPYCFRKREN